MTICIAAICNLHERDTKIVLCADRQVTTSTVQFVATESKIKRITDYCYALQSSNDARVSDLILERVAGKAKQSGITQIKDIVSLVVQECFNHKKEQIERDILSFFNLTADSLQANSAREVLLERATNQVQNYPYMLKFDCIIAGLEPSGEAHIYRINQDGEYWCHDSIGYCAIGSGELNAFLELTKIIYDCGKRWEIAVPLVYFAKKASERATGVGITTDLFILHYLTPLDESCKPTLWNPLADSSITALLNTAWAKMSATYIEQLNNAVNQFIELISKAREAQKQAAKTETVKAEHEKTEPKEHS